MYIHNALSWEILLKDANDLEFIALLAQVSLTLLSTVSQFCIVHRLHQLVFLITFIAPF